MAYSPRKRCSVTASHEPYNRWRSQLDATAKSSSSLEKYYNGGGGVDRDSVRTTSKIDSGDLSHISTSEDVDLALDKIEQLLSEDDQLLKKLEVRQRLNSTESAKNISRSLAIQSSGIVARVNQIERIMCDRKMQAESMPIIRVGDHLLAQKTIRQLDQIRSNMIERPLLPNPPRFHQVLGRNRGNGDNNYTYDRTRLQDSKRAADYHRQFRLLQRKQLEISLLARRNETAIHLKQQWQKSTRAARAELAQLQHWIEQLVPLSIELVNPSADAALDSAHGQVLRLLEQPESINEGMEIYIDKQMTGIASAFSE